MPVTSPDNLRYPTGNDAPAGHTQMQNLANDVQAALTAIRNKPLCVLRLAVAKSVPSNTLYDVPFEANTELVDTHNFHNTQTNSNRITVSVSGYYRFSATAYWQNEAGSERRVEVTQNGVALPPNGRIIASISVSIPVRTEVIARVNAGDYFSMRVIQTTGANLNLIGTSTQNDSFATIFDCEYIRPL